MLMNRKKLLLTVAGLVFLIGAVVGAWYFFFSNGDAELTVGNPFDGLGSGQVSPGSDLPTDGVQQQAGEELAPRFIRITEGPVARGVVAFRIAIPVEPTESVEPAVDLNATTSTSTVATARPSVTQPARTRPDTEVRFIDRASGNVYAFVAGERTLTRISNRTLPGVQTASWVGDGSRAYVRFLAAGEEGERVDTYALPADGQGGFLLESNLDQALVAGTSTLVTVFAGSTGSVGTIANADGTNQRTLFSSLLSSLVVHPTRGNLFGMTRPSAYIDGYAFEINRSTGVFSRILGPLRGLSVLPSPNGSRLLYSYTEGNTVRLRVLDTGSRTSTALPVGTMVEKCVWTSDSTQVYCGVPLSVQGVQPDFWYQGATRFSDRIWRIDMTERIASLVIDPNEVGGVVVDTAALAVDPVGDVLVFMDRHTGALFSYDL